MDARTLLLERNSHGKLEGPAPSAEQLDTLYRAALRAPDHKGLMPWRFVEISGEGRKRLGELSARAEKSRKPDISEEKLDSIQAKAERAPMIIAVIARIQDNKKVPRVEQVASAACAAHAMLYAAQLEGLGAMWRTGDFAHSPIVREGFGLTPVDELVGFIYLGHKSGHDKHVTHHNPDDFVEKWQ